jgi:hypothetical protein
VRSHEEALYFRIISVIIFAIVDRRLVMDFPSDDDGMPLQGVTIKLLDANDVVIATTTTDSDGKFSY